MSAKRTSWNEFSSTMTFVVIFLSTDRKFKFSKYIFESLMRNVNSTSKFYMYPRFIQLLIRNQLGDLSTHTTKYTSPALTQKVFSNIRRVGKGFSRVETPLFKGMLVAGVIEEAGDAEEQVQDVADDVAAQGTDTAVQGDDAQEPSIPSHTPPTPPTQQPQDLPSTLYRVKKLEKGNMVKVLKLRRLKKVRTSLRIDTSDDTVMEDASNQGRMIDDLDKDNVVSLMDDKEEEKKEEEEDEPAKVQEVVDVVTTVKLITEVATVATTTISAAEPQVPIAATTTAAPVRVAAASTRRTKGVVIRDPEEESTTIIPADTKSKDKGKGIMVEEPKPLKKKQQVEMDEEYARRLHKELNKDIDWNVAIKHVKQKAKEDLAVQRYQVMKKRPQTDAQARKNMIMYLKNVATPLARKVPVVDYEIIHLNNKPHYKIIRADGTHQLWTSSSLEESKDCPWSSEGRYPLSRFTLDQMLNAVRLRVEEHSEMSLELLRFTRQ
nr:hypothetical protein [Tanacetum cinerariifolium]